MGGRRVTQKMEDQTSMSGRIALNFVLVSIIYFLVGAIWMGFGPWLPEPPGGEAYATAWVLDIFNTARVHVMVLGWASFAIIGATYYFVPKAASKELHSARLGRIHFWLTNITFPVATVVVTYMTFIAGSMAEAGMAEPEVMGTPPVSFMMLTYIILMVIGFGAQVIFAYNIYRTAR